MNSPQWRRGPTTNCQVCGQTHLATEPLVYDYTQEVDEDLLCQICLQPLVIPSDTKCGHTFCHASVSSYLTIQPLCSLDRTQLTPNDCQVASLMVRRCCGANRTNSFQINAVCGYRGPRRSVPRHQPSCVSLPNPDGAPRTAVVEGELSKIEIWFSSGLLGLRIVGGSDLPLRCIVIQEVFPGDAVALDGRLKPGDQLIEVNGDDLTRCTHMQACTTLVKNTTFILLTIYRDRTESYGSSATEGVVTRFYQSMDIDWTGFAIPLQLEC